MSITQSLLPPGQPCSTEILELLDDAFDRCLKDGDLSYPIPEESVQETLLELPIIGTGCQKSLWVLSDSALHPWRYWEARKQLFAALTERVDQKSATGGQDVRSCLLDYEQKEAVRAALGQRFTVITGGPGSGKSTVASHIIDSARARNEKLAIAICAPTGKAVQRLRAAFGGLLSNAPTAPLELSTVHSLLRLNPDKLQAEVRRVLPFDIVIVDEVSMLDLELACTLTLSCSAVSHLIWLGDADQLRSVGAGAVLHDVITQLPSCVCRLQKSYRFAGDSIIDRLAGAVMRNDHEMFTSALGERYLIEEHQRQRLHIEKKTGTQVRRWCQLCEEENYHVLFTTLADSIILTPQRVGTRGLQALNAHLSTVHGQRAVRPLIARHSRQGIVNGDLAFRINDRYLFRTAEGDVQWYSVPPVVCDDAWVLTVHQAQGSEFHDVVIWIDESMNKRLFERRLLYTAITRSRKNILFLSRRRTLSYFFDDPAER